MKNKLLLASVTLILAACGKPFPISQDLYTEYQGIVCKISTGGLTPQDIVRQTELNAIFQKKLTEGGQPSADWVATHAKKLGEVMDVKNCGKLAAGSSTAAAAPAAASGDPKLAKFDGIWMFSGEKSKAANAEGDEMQKGIAQGIIMGLEIQLASSAGVKIEGGRVQDGEGRCTFEGEPDAKGFVSCVAQSDRSVYAKFAIDPKGDLVASNMGGMSFPLVFEKKK
jgi:hypothetical protein